MMTGTIPKSTQDANSAIKNGVTPLKIFIGFSPVIIAVVNTELPTGGVMFPSSHKSTRQIAIAYGLNPRF